MHDDIPAMQRPDVRVIAVLVAGTLARVGIVFPSPRPVVLMAALSPQNVQLGPSTTADPQWHNRR